MLDQEIETIEDLLVDLMKYTTGDSALIVEINTAHRDGKIIVKSLSNDIIVREPNLHAALRRFRHYRLKESYVT